MVVLGLLVTLVGIFCGALALRRTWTEHAPGEPLVPVTESLRALRDQSGRLIPPLRGEPVLKTGTDVLAAGTVETSGVLTAKMLPQGSATTEELVDHLLRRVDRIQTVADEDRAATRTEATALRADLAAVTVRLDAETHQREVLTRSLALGTIRLQLFGLILVGVGTALMAVPSL